MSPQSYTFPRFVTKETQNKFRKIIKNRKFHQETGFLIIHDQPYYGLPKELASTIHQHNWKTFVQHSPNNNIYAPIVQEFYSCLLDHTPNYVFVRGFHDFTPKHINFHYGLINNLDCDDDVADEYHDLKNTVSEENLCSIMKTLTAEGTDWKREERKNIWKVSWDALKPVPNVWYQFISAKLLPSSDFENVDRDRLLLLHCILEGRSINIGKIIYDEIIDYAFKMKEKDRLLFGSIISDLCIRNGVDAEDDDEVLMNEEAIDLGGLNPPPEGEVEEESFVHHDNGDDDSKGREKEKSDKSAAPSSQSASSRFQIRIKTCPSASLMAKKRKRSYVDLSFDDQGNEEEEVVKMKLVPPVVTNSKKRLKTTAGRRRSCSKLKLEIVAWDMEDELPLSTMRQVCVSDALLTNEILRF